MVDDASCITILVQLRAKKIFSRCKIPSPAPSIEKNVNFVSTLASGMWRHLLLKFITSKSYNCFYS